MRTKKFCKYCGKEIEKCRKGQKFHEKCLKEHIREYYKKYNQLPRVKKYIREYYKKYNKKYNQLLRVKKARREYSKKYYHKVLKPFKEKQKQQILNTIWRKMHIKAQEFLHPQDIRVPLDYEKILIHEGEK